MLCFGFIFVQLLLTHIQFTLYNKSSNLLFIVIFLVWRSFICYNLSHRVCSSHCIMPMLALCYLQPFWNWTTSSIRFIYYCEIYYFLSFWAVSKVHRVASQLIGNAGFDRNPSQSIGNAGFDRNPQQETSPFELFWWVFKTSISYHSNSV